MCHPKKILAALILLAAPGFQAIAQQPVITVRFANPEFECSTLTYSLDVEFQSDTPDKQLYGMNVRFYYADQILEFVSFGEFQQGYGAVTPNPPYVTTGSSSSGTSYFGFPGAYEYINGAVQKVSASSIYLSTTDWTKLFNISFHVDDPASLNIESFAPSVIWDLKENPADGGISGSAGVVITVVSGEGSVKTTENVVQFNWQYDGVPELPYGYPIVTDSTSTICDYAPNTYLPTCGLVTPGLVNLPVTVVDFENIGAFSLVFEYDPAILTYVSNVPNSAFINRDALITITDSISTGGKNKITMIYQGDAITLNDSAHLADLYFNYNSGTTEFTWKTDSNSCQYADSNYIPVYDQPYSDYYINGNIVGGANMWTGATSGDWNAGSNWLNNIVPDQYTDVILDPSSAPTNWPVVTGNFTLGVQCKNLTLAGDAQLSVSGNLAINPGHTLNVTGTGILQIGGNWTNSGIFNPGAGTVEFAGNLNGIIAEGVAPGDFIEGYVLSTFTAGMTAITGGSAGPSGDNAHSDVNLGFNFSYLGIDYSTARINTNGWLSLNQTGDDATSNDNTLLFSASAPVTALAPWWDDLRADTSTAITYVTEGAAPSRVFIAEWKDVLAYNSGATTRLNFQVKLYETTNVIEFCYGIVTGETHNEAEGASIGIKDATGGIGNFIEATQNSMNLSMTTLNSATDWPAENFRFSPPVEYTEEIFNKVVITKAPGKLYVQRNVRVTGMN